MQLKAHYFMTMSLYNHENNAVLHSYEINVRGPSRTGVALEAGAFVVRGGVLLSADGDVVLMPGSVEPGSRSAGKTHFISPHDDNARCLPLCNLENCSR